MSEISSLLMPLALAETAISPGAVFAVVILLALIVLGVSLWLFRLQLKARRNMLTREYVVKRCPYCNAVMDPEASYCPNCGRPVPQVTTIERP